MARFFLIRCLLGQDVIANTSRDLRQFRQRQFLNFNDGINYVHDNPSLDGELPNQAAKAATLVEVSREGERTLSRG